MPGKSEAELSENEDTQKDKYLTFSIGSENYGIAIGYVKEIIGIQPVTEIPEFPSYMKGIINLRGKIIPVMDVRLRFKKPAQAYSDRTCIIVIDISQVSVGLIVDKVAEVLTIPESEIAAPPEVGKGASKYIKGFGKVGNEVKLLLDCTILLNEEAENLKMF